MSEIYWCKMYPKDLLSSGSLQCITPEAECLAMRMLWRMSLSPEYGVLLNPAGKSVVTMKDFEPMAGRIFPNGAALWQEVVLSGFFKWDAQKRITSERMLLDAERTKRMTDIGKLGGNPVLVNWNGADKLALEAHAAFGKPPTEPDRAVLEAVKELRRLGRTDDEIRALIRWRKKCEDKFRPRSPHALLDPSAWEKWHSMIEGEPQRKVKVE